VYATTEGSASGSGTVERTAQPYIAGKVRGAGAMAAGTGLGGASGSLRPFFAFFPAKR